VVCCWGTSDAAPQWAAIQSLGLSATDANFMQTKIQTILPIISAILCRVQTATANIIAKPENIMIYHWTWKSSYYKLLNIIKY